MARGTLVSELRTVPDDAAAVLDLVETQGWGDGFPVIPPTEQRVQRSEERRVGKECRSRWSPYH